MKTIFEHKDTGIRVMLNEEGAFYSCTNSVHDIKLPKFLVETSKEWFKVHMPSEEVGRLMDIRCLSINDVAKVYVTANRLEPKKESGMSDQAFKLLQIVEQKVNTVGNI